MRRAIFMRLRRTVTRRRVGAVVCEADANTAFKVRIINLGVRALQLALQLPCSYDRLRGSYRLCGGRIRPEAVDILGRDRPSKGMGTAISPRGGMPKFRVQPS